MQLFGSGLGLNKNENWRLQSLTDQIFDGLELALLSGVQQLLLNRVRGSVPLTHSDRHLRIFFFTKFDKVMYVTSFFSTLYYVTSD